MNKVQVPSMGQKITMDGKKLIVPDNPIIPFIEGDGIGPIFGHLQLGFWMLP